MIPGKSPVDTNLLADYWLAELPDAEEASLEEHLLGCDECGGRLREMIDLANGIRTLAREGNLRVVLSSSFLDRLKSQGVRVREYLVPRGGGVACTVTKADDLLIGRLAADLATAGHVDVAFYDEAGTELRRLQDVPFSAAGREVIFNEPIAQARLYPAHTILVKLLAVDEQGERLLGEYTFNHTPS